MASEKDFCTIRERRTSGWCVIVTRGAVLSAAWLRSEPCTRVLAYSSALRYPVERVAIALLPTIIRAFSMTWNICAMPSWTSPSSQPLAGSPPPTPESPKVSSQVLETLIPILCSTLVT